MLSLQTLVAYCRTSYSVDFQSTYIDVRIGQTHPELDALLKNSPCDGWAIVTAWNPRSQLLDEAENARRHEDLKELLDRSQFEHWSAFGIGDEPGWIPEAGFLIAGISLSDALELGRRFEQSAIVAGTIGQPATLHFPFPKEAAGALAEALHSDDAVVRWVAELARKHTPP